jgi:hypothetical protein
MTRTLFSGGRIVESWTQWDGAQVLGDFGVIPNKGFLDRWVVRFDDARHNADDGVRSVADHARGNSPCNAGWLTMHP